MHTNRYTPQGYVSTHYTADEIDAIAAYSSISKRCYLVPLCDVTNRRGVHLRITPARNNQAAGVRWARDYEFEATLRRDFGLSQDDLNQREPSALEALG